MNGKRFMWVIGFVLAALALVACAPPLMVGSGPVPTASSPPEVKVTPTTVVPSLPVTQYTLSITASQDSESAATTVFEQSIYPLRSVTFTRSADGMVDLPAPGTPVLALGRIVPDAAEPITTTQAITWLLFSAVDSPSLDTRWLQTRTDTSGGQVHTLGIEHSIARERVIVLPKSGEDALLGLLEARDSWAEEHEVQVYLENVLMRETDANGDETWTLWAFHNDPGGGAGAAGKDIFCQKYLKCSTATDRWATTVCNWFCQ